LFLFSPDGSGILYFFFKNKKDIYSRRDVDENAPIICSKKNIDMLSRGLRNTVEVFLCYLS
jgi:hypothetical protein